MIFTFFASFAFTQQKRLTGTGLCNQLYELLKENSLNPKTQNLLINSENEFPYNIYSEIEGSSQNSSNLLLIFTQEKAVENFDLVKKTFNFIKQENFPFNTSILFSYGEQQELLLEDAIFGNKAFINSLELNENFTAILINPGEEKNQIFAANDGNISPSWLFQSCYNRFAENQLKLKTSFFYLSQLSSFYFIKDRQLDAFFDNGIPAIKLNISKEASEEQIYNCLTLIISDYSQNLQKDWEQNFLMVNFFGHFKIISETFMVFGIIVLFFLIFLFLFVFGYINSFIKNDNWKKIRYVWWIAPLTLILVILGFFAGKLFSLIDFSNSSYGKIYFQLFWQLTLSVLFVAIFYNLLMVFNVKIEERSVDFLVLISTFINQSLFAIYDISVFPILFLIFIAAFLTIFFKNIFSHGFLFIVMVIILIPYTHTFITNENGKELLNYFYSKSGYIFAFAMISTPIFLLYLRIFIKFSIKHPLYKQLFIFSGLFCSFIILIQTVICIKEIPKLEKQEIKQEQPIITSKTISDISLEVKDKNIFDDLYRTITIDTKKDCLFCEVEILGEENNPVQYSDAEFEQKNSNLSSFKIPYCPPQIMKFTYGTTKSPCKIKVSAIYKAKMAENLILEEKTFDIGETE